MVSPCRRCVDTQSHTGQYGNAQILSRVCWHGMTRPACVQAFVVPVRAGFLRQRNSQPPCACGPLWSCRTAATYSGGCMTPGSILLPCSRKACMQPAAARALHVFLACACRTCRGCARIVRTHPIGHLAHRAIRACARPLGSCAWVACIWQLPSPVGFRHAAWPSTDTGWLRPGVPLAGVACAGPVGCPLQQSGCVQVVDIGWGAVVGVCAAEFTCLYDSCAAGKHVGVLAQFLQTTCKG